MMKELLEVLQVLTNLQPLGVIALLSTIVFMLVSKRGPMRRLTDNHATHIQDSLERIAGTMDRIADHSERHSDALDGIRTDIAIVKDRGQR